MFQLCFLEDMLGRIFKDKSDHVGYQIACVMQSIYGVDNFKWIFSSCFIANFVQSTIPVSKTVTILNGEVFLGVSHTTYHSSLNNGRNKHLVCSPGNIERYINNIGRDIIKNYRASKTKKNTADVITTTQHIKLDEKIQADSSFQAFKLEKRSH